MNYRHIYHAGNFADVFKHVILVQLLQSLARKDAGFAYLETHAGAGRYDLHAPPARKSGEYRTGIERVWGRATGGGLGDYLAVVAVQNPDGDLRCYPGSPRIARALLRAQDRMRLAEQLPEACAALKSEFAGDRQVSVTCGDGYAALKAWLPPRERRGLVLLDPSYESQDEWEHMRCALALARRRWAQGIYALWYPLKAGTPLGRFKAALVADGWRNILQAELMISPPDTPFRLNGCGMLIYNPPWQLDTRLPALLDPLARLVQQGTAADVTVQWLVPE